MRYLLPDGRNRFSIICQNQQDFLFISLLIRGFDDHEVTTYMVMEIIYVILLLCVVVFNTYANTLLFIVVDSTLAPTSGLGREGVIS
jgi:hypothetical protein